MARKNKYSKVKPKVSPLTYVIVGVVLVGLILTIILSISTPKERFNSRFGLDKENNYQLIKLKKLENRIDKGEELVVIIGFKSNPAGPLALLNELQVTYDETNNRYDGIDREILPVTIYYLEVNDVEALADFNVKYELRLTTQDPMMLAFNYDEETVIEFNGAKDHGVIAGDTDLANRIRNIKEFFAKLNEED